MARKRRAHNEAAWRNAKAACRLNARQVEMARALGMNPKKLPGLRPSPQQRWKLPVGAFIEECYQKRFGGRPPEGRSGQPAMRRRDVPAGPRTPAAVQDPVRSPWSERLPAESWEGGRALWPEDEDEIPF